MPITFFCGCGQSMTVRDEFAGKMGRCPRCKQPVSVPLTSTAAPLAPMPQFAPPPPPPGMPPMPLPQPGPATPRPMPRPGAAPPLPPGMPARPGAPTALGAPAMAPARPATGGPQARPQAAPGQSGPVARPGQPGRPAAKKGAKLLVVNGPQGYAGKVYPVQTGKPTVIGRDPQADVPIPSERISRKHCQLEPAEDGLYVVADLGSSNGTLVNQERVNGRKVLLGGEYIQVGDVLLRFADS